MDGTEQHFMPEDLAMFQDLGQLDACAGANAAACVVRSVDLANDSYTSAIWIFGLDGAPGRVIPGTGTDNQPRWSPDATTLAFVSSRGGSAQAYVVPAQGGEPRQLTSFPEGVGSIEWSPGGDRLLVSRALNLDADSREQRRESAPAPPDAPELAWRLPYKSDGVGYLLRRAFHLFSVDVASGAVARVTAGPFDVLSAAWSPDGQRIAYVRTREGPLAHRTDLWVANADGSGARQLTSELAVVASPHWSPDGSLIVVSGARREGDAQTRLFVVEAATGSIRQLAHDDLEVAAPESVHWATDGASITLIVAHRACQHIVSVAVTSGTVTTLVGGERHIAELSIAGNRLAYFSESAMTPRELFAARRDGAAERQLSQVNAWWWSRTPLEAHIHRFRVPDGRGGEETIEGWVVRAQDSHGPQPLMVEAHGGPNSFALLGFPWNTYWNTLCSKGWTVVVPHAVGSTSFGRDFAQRLDGRWGELDFPQYLAVLDALQREGIASQQSVIAGKSYGGYMAAWAVGHTDRFTAAIVAAPVADLQSHFGTSDGGYYGQASVLGGAPHEVPARYRALSPVTFIHQCVTPTLILQGKEDERCPRGQSEQLFATLMSSGRAPCEMVLYPGGGHHFFETGKPSHRLDVVRRMIGWIDRWVQPEVRPDAMPQVAAGAMRSPTPQRDMRGRPAPT